ncbi:MULTISPECIES: CRISPR-associated DxTHG motif protein [Thermotoga]|uniref:CRISPR-associated protein, Csx2 family n=1 Tax=Thermotoga neapolitana (strain ATCC 49049 / DSM 4359 / NBRC 107923 / NS-E) TaxID=309803 RepID=B9K7E4_THENN|nr:MULTISPECIES: TM1812 family CRISPR-associated protein [Thermotoga]ACM22877.1 CRISPR-associated protein, Csx2 family [Thermotoga neapolitana DSM 4359]AJG40802.1 CRISPR-associated protein [Thermotoga sp. RQ7]HBF11458.1 CRISPR-associated DxTHG motif protein [Thermotoga neapolitana]
MHEFVKLVTFLGVGNYRESLVKISPDFCVRQKVFPLAIVDYLHHLGKSVEVLFFLTEESRQSETWLECRNYLENKNVSYKFFSIPERVSSEVVMNSLVRTLVENLKEDENIILDITHSFRSFPLMAGVVALYLKEAKRIDVRVIYGKFDPETNTTECEDLTPLTRATEWIYAVRLFREYGYAKELAHLIRKRNEEIHRKNSSKKPRILNSLSSSLQNISFSLRIGSIKAIRKNLSNFFEFFDGKRNQIRSEVKEFVPEIAALLDVLEKSYRVFHIERGGLKLNEEELESERKLLNFYLQTGDLGMALRLAREYLINAYLMMSGEETNFLERDVRESVNLSKLGYDIILQARNHVARFGFNKVDLPSLNKIEKAIKSLVSSHPERILISSEKSYQSRKAALLTPLGTTKGALYTVLKHFSPDLLLIVTSKQGKEILPEILEKVKYKNDYKVILLEDPFTGVNEINRVISEAREYLADSDEIIVNLTGGTTLLTYLVECIKNHLRYGRKIKTVLAVDRRSYEEQIKNPFVVGEILELE